MPQRVHPTPPSAPHSHLELLQQAPLRLGGGLQQIGVMSLHHHRHLPASLQAREHDSGVQAEC